MNKGLVSRRSSASGNAPPGSSAAARGVRKPHVLGRTGSQESTVPGQGYASLSVVVPAYNEEQRIAETVSVIWAYLDAHCAEYELIVVDDGSHDGTAQVVELFARHHVGVKLVAYPRNRGKGYAVRTGVLEARGALVLFSDADLSTPIEEVEALAAEIDAGSAVAIGSRAVPGSELRVRQPWYRELAGRSFNVLAQVLATPGLKDTQCGFKLFERAAAAEIFGRVVEEGFSFDIEVLHVALRLGYPVSEVPVAWRHHAGSKVRLLRDSARMFGALWRVRRRHLGLRAAARSARVASVSE